MLNKSRFKANPNDFIIIIMGPNGAGKTNFVNALTGNAAKPKAGDLRSATQNVTPYTIPYRGHRLVLVDTPGFDNTYWPDTEILRLIADWLTKKYPDGDTLKLTGIIYLHRITDKRMSGSVYKNLQMFGRLCGNISLHRARLITSMWDIAKGHAGLAMAEKRESELLNDFWQPLIAEGAVAKRFDNTAASAFHIVDELIDMECDKSELLLQAELVEHQKRLGQTEAGKVLNVYSRLEKLLAEQRNTLEDLMAEAKLQNDPDRARSLQEEYDKVNAMLQKISEETKAMKTPLPRRMFRWLFGRKYRAKAVELGESPG